MNDHDHMFGGTFKFNTYEMMKKEKRNQMKKCFRCTDSPYYCEGEEKQIEKRQMNLKKKKTKK